MSVRVESSCTVAVHHITPEQTRVTFHPAVIGTGWCTVQVGYRCTLFFDTVDAACVWAQHVIDITNPAPDPVPPVLSQRVWRLP